MLIWHYPEGGGGRWQDASPLTVVPGLGGLTMTPFGDSAGGTRFSLNIGGQIYGPYTHEQMRTYVKEGRVTAETQVSRNNGPWLVARDEPMCAAMLSPRPGASDAKAPEGKEEPAPDAPLSPREAFLKEMKGIRLKSPVVAERSPASDDSKTDSTGKDGQSSRETHDDPISSANMLIAFNVKSRGHNYLEASIMNLGEAIRINSGLWAVHTTHSVNAIRGTLLPQIGSTDTLIIVDASRDRVVTGNYGPEIETSLRQVWRKR